jgi:mannitol-1-phosphate/altronate dehydrogenase
MSQVRMLINLKVQLDEEVATVWLTTTEMGFSLTDESHMAICSRDVREGK